MHHLVPPLASSSTETRALLAGTAPSRHLNFTLKVCFRRLSSTICQSRYLCLPSKAAILILLWTAVIGAVNTAVIGTIALVIDLNTLTSGVSISLSDSLSYALLAVMMMFYPISGFLADICCGRFRTVMCGLLSVLMFLLLVSLITIFELLHNFGLLVQEPLQVYRILFIIIGAISVIFFVIGLAGYQANFIQLGLEQLLEAPSEYLGLFVHLSMWVYNLTSAVVALLFVMTSCYQINSIVLTMLYSSPVVYAIILSLLLILSYQKRHWFYMERGQANPYTTVIRVLNFVRKHKYPLQRSAFTYSDDVMPSRLDFAKERFGGPFTTEQVEDVKTFLRIVIVLLSLGPVHVLQVPASSFLFPLYGSHVTHYVNVLHDCSGHKLLLQTGNLMSITSMVFFPLYIWMLFLLFRSKKPKMLTRLRVGVVLFLLGVIIMLITDAVGHSLQKNKVENGTQCMFHFTFDNNGTLQYPTLNMHWSVLIPPNVLLGIGQLMFEVTVLEFISAQSPHSMKGLLIGIFFAIKGLFRLLSSTIFIPFSLKHPWGVMENPPFISCGSIYLLFTCVVGLIGLVLFSVAAKMYKNRKRDDVTFRQRDVEEIYDRYLTQAAAAGD